MSDIPQDVLLIFMDDLKAKENDAHALSKVHMGNAYQEGKEWAFSEARGIMTRLLKEFNQ